MGVFAAWQPRYADLGIAVFPVRDKRPAVRKFDRIGLRASAKLALRFGDHPGLGFFAGARSKITVLDVDSQDITVLRDALKKHGETPFVVQTSSGHWHAYYQHSGEPRRIKPWTGVPVDLLGSGLVVAPPTVSDRGAYEIIKGTLADLRRLPPLRAVDLSHAPDPPLQHFVGVRNREVWRHCMRQARYCDDFQTLMDVAETFNDRHCEPPLATDEVKCAAGSAWRYTESGRNYFGRRVVAIEVDHVDQLAAAHPHAFALLAILHRHHWQRDRFVLARAMAKSMGWSLPRFLSAREELELLGLIRCLHGGGRGANDPPIYEWSPKGYEITRQ